MDRIHPINIPRSSWADRRKKIEKILEENRLIEKLESYINNFMASYEGESRKFSYGFISIETGITLNLVANFLQRIGGGGSGIIIIKKPE